MSKNNGKQRVTEFDVSEPMDEDDIKAMQMFDRMSIDNSSARRPAEPTASGLTPPQKRRRVNTHHTDAQEMVTPPQRPVTSAASAAVEDNILLDAQRSAKRRRVTVEVWHLPDTLLHELLVAAGRDYQFTMSMVNRQWREILKAHRTRNHIGLQRAAMLDKTDVDEMVHMIPLMKCAYDRSMLISALRGQNLNAMLTALETRNISQADVADALANQNNHELVTEFVSRNSEALDPAILLALLAAGPIYDTAKHTAVVNFILRLPIDFSKTQREADYPNGPQRGRPGRINDHVWIYCHKNAFQVMSNVVVLTNNPAILRNALFMCSGTDVYAARMFFEAYNIKATKAGMQYIIPCPV